MLQFSPEQVHAAVGVAHHIGFGALAHIGSNAAIKAFRSTAGNEKQDKEFLIWARPEDFENYSSKSHGDRVLVCGHTPTQSLMGDSSYDTPIQIRGTIFIDTGSFFSGKLSLVELPSKSFWQS